MAKNGTGALHRALGLMSGTSMDGIDCALIETDGGDTVRFGPASVLPFEDSDRDLLRRALAEAEQLSDRTARPGVLLEAERMITARHAEAVEQFLAQHGMDRSTIEIVGFHGQTVIHRPTRGLTVQIGDGAALARAIGIDVVADFRAADVAAGGQGAPLVPAFHHALARSSKLSLPVLVVNIGGVANITFIDGDRDPIACDTGPGNALLDDLMLSRTGVPIDQDGAMAGRGQVDRTALSALLDHPFFAVPPPKSLDRNAFSAGPVIRLSTEDAAATLTAFTAETIAGIVQHLPAAPASVVVCGGGARNPTLMARLRQCFACPVGSADQQGWSGDAVEAQAFAYLAVRSLDGLPLTYPSTTGVSAPVTGGELFRAAVGA